jgi:electron transfer flavoprotein beta subunit
LRILIFIKGVYDTKVPMEYEESTGSLKADRNVTMLNPSDRRAIDCALEIRESGPENHIVLVHLGPSSSERFLREGLALGCDEALRVWDDDLCDLQTQAKAVILSRLARIYSSDLILAGSKSQDRGTGQLGSLVAAILHVPCITVAMSLQMTERNKVIATKQLSDGSVQHIESLAPLVVTVEGSSEARRSASFPAFVDAAEREIPCLGLAEMGISETAIRQANSVLSFGPLRLPGSRLKYVAAPDSALPAYERRMQLLEGSMKKRLGKTVKGEDDQVVEALFRTLLDGGWLSKLRPRD